jgi:hypothetical protein
MNVMKQRDHGVRKLVAGIWTEALLLPWQTRRPRSATPPPWLATTKLFNWSAIAISERPLEPKISSAIEADDLEHELEKF